MKIDNRQSLLIAVAVAAVVILAGDRLVFTPLSHVWSNRVKEIADLRLKVRNGKAMINRDHAIRARWDSMQNNTLPNNQSLAQEQVLKALVSWSQESGVAINGTTPQWKNDAPEYKTLVCRVDASGTLWTLSRFLYDIEQGPLGLRIESLDLSAHDNNGQQLALGLQISGLVLTPPAK